MIMMIWYGDLVVQIGMGIVIPPMTNTESLRSHYGVNP